MNSRIGIIVFLFAVLSLGACSDPCDDLLNSVCNVRPNKALCERLTFKIKKKKMSSELCGHVDEAYWDLLEQRAQE
jgi:hypothetical protein